MGVPAHRLGSNVSTAVPDRHVILDTETLENDLGGGRYRHTLRVGVALAWKRPATRQRETLEELVFRHADRFWSWLDARAIDGKRLVVWAHNIGFDLQVLGGLEPLTTRGYHFTRSVIDTERVILAARRGRATILFLDFFNFYHGSLEQAAAELHLRHLALPESEAPETTWLARCRTDVHVLHAAVRAWLELIERHDLGYFGMTLPAQALHAYKHRLRPVPIFLHREPHALELEAAAYMGGRTECWRLGKQEEGYYALLDGNSAYAAVMYDELYPTARIGCGLPVDPLGLRRALEGHLAVARVTIRTETPIYPCRLEERLCFPVGRFETTLTTPELLVALERGEVERVGHYELYQGAPIFRRYVAELYPLRLAYLEAGDAFRAGLMRALLVALFGKFGQRIVRWSAVGDEEGEPDAIFKEYDGDRGVAHVYRRIGGHLEHREREQPGYDAFPAIPAHVTAYQRLRLYRLAETAGLENVLYLDTDALIVNPRGLEGLTPHLHPTALGALKIEDTATTLELVGAKVYHLGQRVRHKGRSPKARDLGGGVYVQDEFVSLAEAMRRGERGGPIVERVKRRTTTEYHKGIVMPDGRVVPLRLPQERDALPDVVRDDGDVQRPELGRDRLRLNE